MSRPATSLIPKTAMRSTRSRCSPIRESSVFTQGAVPPVGIATRKIAGAIRLAVTADLAVRPRLIRAKVGLEISHV